MYNLIDTFLQKMLDALHDFEEVVTFKPARRWGGVDRELIILY